MNDMRYTKQTNKFDYFLFLSFSVQLLLPSTRVKIMLDLIDALSGPGLRRADLFETR